MNGAQDLGGMHGFGPVMAEPNEPVFHAPWERRLFALAMAMGFTGTWSLDASRGARESLPPADYLSSSYYEIWLKALEAQILEHGLAAEGEMVSGTATTPPRPLKRVLKGGDVAPLFGAGFPSDRTPEAAPRFAIGDRIVVRNINPAGHTRVPRYIRSRPGIVERIHGAFVFPDANAKGEAAPPQWLYSVGFSAEDIWGEDAPAKTNITVAMFESYVVPAQATP